MGEVSRIGKRLKRFRLAKGMTQEELAIAGNTSRGLIANAERGGRQNMMIDTAARLARALGVTLDQLYGFDLLDEMDEMDVEEEMAAASV
jgi:transcriptional regulator with XRE-family HTH domain